jgi:hypothetical protein
MVREVEKPSLRAASCCSVEVMNGGDGPALALLAGHVGDAQRVAGVGDQARARGLGRLAVGDRELLELLAVQAAPGGR